MIANWYKSEEVITAMRESENVQDLIDDLTTLDEAKNTLTENGFNVRDVHFSEGPRLLVIKIDSNTFVIDDSLMVRDAYDWIWMIDPSDYVQAEDFNKRFWDEAVNGYLVYHATTSQNVNNILKNGLQRRSDSRGLSNRGFPSAVFTSENIEDIESYGSTVISIDVGSMKQDGFMPPVALEEPIEEAFMLGQVATKMGLENIEEQRIDSLWHEGIRQSTIIFLESIPPKYLKLIK